MAIELFNDLRDIATGIGAKVTGTQLVDASGIGSAALGLNDVNNTIKEAFEKMEKESKRLEADWNSSAGDTARTIMYEIFKNSEVRYSVIQNYVNMLNQQVIPGYESAEETNTSLADQFK